MERRPRAKVRPFLFVDGNLRDAANLVLDRVFDGDDLVFVALDLVERGVEGGGFAGAGGSGDQHHAVGLANVAAEAAQVFVGEAHHVEREVLELLAHRLLVEDAQHGIFAVNRGHDGHAEVDEAALVAHAEAAVLRHALLGDVELAHDLDAAQDGAVVLAGDGRHGLLQHAVDAVLDVHRIVVAFNMNVGGAALQGGEDRGVHKANNGADVFGVAGELLDGDVFVGVFVAGEHVEGQAFAGLVEDALRLLGFLQQVGDLRERGHARRDARPKQPGNLIQHHQPRGVADRDDQRVWLLLDGHEVVAEHELHRHGAQQFVLNLEVFEVDELGVIARGQSFSLGALVHSPWRREWEA